MSISIRRRPSYYKNCIWLWDEEITEGLTVKKDATQHAKMMPTISGISMASMAKKTYLETEIKLADVVDSYGQAKFRRYYRRKVIDDKVKDVVTIQDIKDVAIFTCNSSQLNVEFIGYFHTQAMDKFLRALLIYFQYYIQTKFRRYYQRKVKTNDPAVVTIQDIKDVTIYTCRPGQISLEFVSYFHTKTMDRFLRSLLVYFQYYMQVWNKMQLRRIEATRKLRQPVVTTLEDTVSDNLGDLRAMLARNYAAMLMGMGDARQFHHMSNKNNDSLSDKDRRLFETLCFMLIKFTWIGLFRKHFALIAKEINRLLRTDLFNAEEHASTATNATSEESRVLLGNAYAAEKRLLHRSPAIQEIVLKDHDYRMLAIGICQIHTDDPRINYLEAVYSAPEELLLGLGVGFGIVGIERKYLDPMLRPLEMSTTEKRRSVMEVYEFELPPKSDLPATNLKEITMDKPGKYQETLATKAARRKQCFVWKEYITTGGFSITSVLEKSKG